jgi:hypothetical protein
MQDVRLNVWWAAFQARVLETAATFPPSLAGTLAIEVWEPSGRTTFKSLRVSGSQVELADGRLPDDTACLSIAADDLPLLLEPGSTEEQFVDLWGDAAFAGSLLAAMAGAPKSKSALALRAGR